MITIRLPVLLSLAYSLACASSGERPADTVTRVGISSGAGSMGATELHTESGGSTSTIPVSTDSVWQALPRVYEMLGIPNAGLEPGRRAYGARNVRIRRIEGKRLSTYIDCGYGPTATPKADEYEITMSLISSPTAATDTTTVVETVLESSGKPRATTGQRISCQSNGTLEARVGELLVALLVVGR